MKSSRILLFLLLSVPAPLWAEPQSSRVKLAVVIVVDQMRPDYLTLFESQYTGGLARLLKQGAVFERAYHDHSCTVTGPGHATLSTGAYPAHNGIVGNSYFDRSTGKVTYCCADTSVHIIGLPKVTGVSAARLLAPTLGDLLKQVHPGAKVVAMGLKDRSPILLAGKTADLALWYARDPGAFVTSSAYAKSAPAWLTAFNASGRINAYADSTWTPLLPDSAYQRFGEDNIPWENDGVHTTFPHPCNPDGGAPGSAYHEKLISDPFGDRLVFELAQQALTNMALGKDSVPDLLLVSCSAADAIGHAYGPDSREVHDYYLRLDLYLQDFFNELDSTVGTGAWVLALSSDHGVMPLPEVAAEKGLPARRVMEDTSWAQINRIFDDVARSWNAHWKLVQLGDGVAFAPEAWNDSSLCIKYSDELAAQIRRLDWVADVFTRRELQDSATSGRPYVNLFRHALAHGRGADLYIREKEYVLVTPYPFGTSHGTVYDYDAHIPLVFLGPGIAAQRITDSVRSVDLAPTLCDWLGVPPSRSFDGHSLAEMIRR